MVHNGGHGLFDADHVRSSGVEPDHTRIPGRVVDMTVLEVDGTPYIFAALDPGVYANMVLIDPLSNDSDSDGMPDGWEFVHGLDPTNPYDRDDDSDADGVNFNPDDDDYLIVVGRILMNSGLYLQLNRAGIPPTRSWLTLMVMDCLTVKSIGASSLNVPISLAIT